MPDGTVNIPVQKIILSIITAALIGAFGWIIKIESHMTRVVADIEDIEDDLSRVERDVAEAQAISRDVQSNRLDLTEVQGLVKGINDKVDDIKRALERLGTR
jgi:uncharacterized membrane protein YjjP (DUF1212 family)